MTRDGLGFPCDGPVAWIRCSKHVVETGLSYLDEHEMERPRPAKAKARTKAKARQRETTIEDVRRYLQGLEGEALVDLVMGQLDRDDAWREALLRTAAMHRPDGVDFGIFKKAITKATRTGPFLDYAEARKFVGGLSSLCDSLAELVEAGPAGPAIDLIEYALKRCEDALNHVDDSSGGVGGILCELQSLHLAACQRAPELSPTHLARRLFDWRMATDWDTFADAPQTYADILGEAGLALFRQLTRAKWDTLPDLPPGPKHLPHDHQRFVLTSLMEGLARADNDIDELIRIRQKDLSIPYRFFSIAELCHEHGRLAEAIDWAERGMAAFPDEHRDTRLPVLLAELYQEAKRYSEAVELAWSLFDQRPGLEGFVRLKAYAQQVRVNGRKSEKHWGHWRRRALARLRDDIVHVSQQPPRANPVRYITFADCDHSRLVEILLWEGDPDAAWQEAQAGGCSESLWLELAKHREATHPADAIAVYQKLVPRRVDQTNDAGYREAIVLVERIQRLMPKAGMAGVWPGYLATLRESYKRKRNFIKMLDDLAG